MDHYLSVVVHHGAGVVMQPQHLQCGQFGEEADFSEVVDAIFAEVKFLNGGRNTCSLLHLAKSLRLDILLTLSEITSRLGIFSIN